MVSFISNPLIFDVEPGIIETFLEDIRNFKLIMPEQVEDWSADETSCSFFIKNLGNLGMKKGNFVVPQRYEFPSGEKSKVRFTLVFHWNPEEAGTKHGYFEIFAEMNAMVEMMARRPLTNFVKILTENFQKVIRNS